MKIPRAMSIQLNIKKEVDTVGPGVMLENQSPMKAKWIYRLRPKALAFIYISREQGGPDHEVLMSIGLWPSEHKQRDKSRSISHWERGT